MKHLKLFGVVVIAALGLMAFAGAGTVSATTLFKDGNLTQTYPAGSTFHATLEPAPRRNSKTLKAT